MLVPGPLLTALFMNIALPPLSSQSKSGSVIAEGSDKLLSSFKENKDLSFISMLGLNKIKNFNWRWLLFFLVLLLSTAWLVLILNFYNINIIYIINKTIKEPMVGKYLLLFFMVADVILILRYIFFILMIYLISKNKITKSMFLPSFLIKTYDNLEFLSKRENLNLIIDFYYKHMFLYIFLFFISLIYYLIIY